MFRVGIYKHTTCCSSALRDDSMSATFCTLALERCGRIHQAETRRSTIRPSVHWATLSKVQPWDCRFGQSEDLCTSHRLNARRGNSSELSRIGAGRKERRTPSAQGSDSAAGAATFSTSRNRWRLLRGSHRACSRRQILDRRMTNRCVAPPWIAMGQPGSVHRQMNGVIGAAAQLLVRLLPSFLRGSGGSTASPRCGQ
jgi:hypothetical protein